MTPFKKYICRACGYIYDEALGDPDDGLPAGTRFDDIADDWQCPLCGVTKSDFELLDDDTPIANPAPLSDGKMGVVIVGAGLAGWAVVDALRALDKQLPIMLVTADNADRYHKPMLSLAFGSGKTPTDLVRQSGEKAALQADISLLAQTFVLDIDSEKRSILTTKGEIFYQKLVLAIGAVPLYPPNISPNQAWHINHLSGFAKLYDKLNNKLNNKLNDECKPPKKHIAIVGAGMVGVELAEDLCRAGHTVSLLGKGDYPLASLLPRQAGEQVAQALSRFGVVFIGALVQSVHSADNGYRLVLDNGQTLSADELVVATGLGIDERLPKRAKIAFDGAGIWVDKTLATTNPDIYAIGDCIAIGGVPCRFIAPHRKQAAAIAHAITGTPFDGYIHTPPPIRLKNKSVSIAITGTPVGVDDWVVVDNDSAEGKLIMEQRRDGQVLAVLTLIQAT